MTLVQVNEPVTVNAGARQVFPAINTRVRVRRNWLQAWNTIDYLQATVIKNAVSPSTSRCDFSFKYGEVSREDRKSFALESYHQLRDQFILVEHMLTGPALNQMGNEDIIAQQFTPLFYGRINDESFIEHNIRRTATDSVASGDQTLIAYGLEQTLDRVMINQAIIETDTEEGIDIIDWVPPFNERIRTAEPHTFGNKSFQRRSRPPLDSNSTPSFIFNGDPNLNLGSGVWTNLDIAEYLLEWFSPDDDLAGDLAVRLGGQTDALANLVNPSIDLEGRTLRQCLDMLIDRRQGLGWTIRVDDEDNVDVHIFTLIDEPVSTAEITIPANAEQHGVQLNDRIKLDEVVITKDTSHTFEIIVILGERMRSTFTLNYPDQLEKAWTQDEEDAYLAATDEERSSAKFSHVFTTFRVKASWDWKSKDGRIVNPNVTVVGELEEEVQAPIRRWDRQILRELPFLKERDPNDLDADPEHEPPLVWLEHPRKLEPMQADRIEDSYPDLKSATIKASDTEFGIEVRFSPNHVLALDEWTPSAAKTKTKPRLSFNNMTVTVQIETDERLKYAIINTAADLDDTQVKPNKILFIEVPDAHMWHVVGGTSRLLELEQDAIGFIPESGGQVRNDLDRLKAIGALAKVWYSKVRTAIDLTIDGITTVHQPGALINAVSNVHEFNESVGSVITDVEFDLTTNKTRVKTGFLELDAKEFI